MELAEEGLPEGTVVQCLEQTKGHGRYGREWVSPLGNLYMSILLRPDCPVAKAGQLSFVAAVALSAAMDDVLEDGHRKTLKWPNDILINGKKVSGIIIEKQNEAYVLGIGVNILGAPEEATFLKALAGDNRLAIHPFRDRTLEKLGFYYEQWQTEGFASIRNLWLSQAQGLNEMLVVKIGDREITGIFRDINENGFLILEAPDGKKIDINSGEVYFPVS